VSAPVIVFDGVWKKFRRGERHDSLRDLVPATVNAIFRRTRRVELEDQEFWAVKDVSFEVRAGEALGIIGPNGAGKSTTLKLLTRILKPTRGTCFVRGRTGALIEVAAGFHPDLTGRENVFLQGAIMGMKRAEIARRFDEIVEFAGVAAFIDTPVKRYSSGMNARLGFSIAAHLDPEALIIDEVLSVGDTAFQEKCVARMTEFKRQGVAIAFVSHNLQAVTSLCDQALYIKSGVLAAGKTDMVLQKYLSDTDRSQAKQGTGAVAPVKSELLDDAGRPASDVRPGTMLQLRVVYRCVEPVSDYHVAFVAFRSTDGLAVYDGNWTGDELGHAVLPAGSELTVDFRFRANLTRGHYHLASHVFHNPTQRYLATIRPAALFAVDETRTFSGVANLDVSPKVEVARSAATA
jgi:lipopolysaccharide transport system ATP-binding protein